MLVIDAYNVLHGAPPLRRVLQAQGRRAACWALIDLLARWRAAHRRPPELVVVFDGAAPLPHGPRISGLQVRFADHEADDEVKALLERAGQHVLVSADGELVAHAARLGLRALTPAAFVEEVELELEAHREVELRDPGPLSEGEVSGWLETFGAAPRAPAAEPAPPRAAPPPDAPPPLDPDEVDEWLDYFGEPRGP